MVSRLILCLDGTWNTANAEIITNIVRIRDLIDPKPKVEGGDAEDQRVYYHDGVGTGLSMRDRTFGGMGGYGLDHNVRALTASSRATTSPSWKSTSSDFPAVLSLRAASARFKTPARVSRAGAWNALV